MKYYLEQFMMAIYDKICEYQNLDICDVVMYYADDILHE